MCKESEDSFMNSRLVQCCKDFLWLCKNLDDCNITRTTAMLACGSSGWNPLQIQPMILQGSPLRTCPKTSVIVGALPKSCFSDDSKSQRWEAASAIIRCFLGRARIACRISLSGKGLSAFCLCFRPLQHDRVDADSLKQHTAV